MVELSHPEEFEHQIVATESVDDCECGGSHDAGDALWGGIVDPREYETLGFEQVERTHDVEVEYREQ